MKKYTPEEIFYEDAGWVSLGIEPLRKKMSKTLSKVRRDIADFVLENCLIAMQVFDYGKGSYLPKEVAKNKHIILLSEKLLEEPEEEFDYVLLHEVAHSYLKHKSSIFSELSTEEEDEQEKEADRLVKQWLKG